MNSLPQSDLLVNLPEEWRDVPGYEGLYQVSNMGRVKSFIRNERLLVPQPSTNGYLQVYLCKDGTIKHARIHRLVALAFIGDCPVGYHVDHINRERYDNRLINLRYLHHSINEAQGTVRKNKLYKYPQPGETNPQSKLTDNERREIVALYATGQYTQREIAAMYGICRQTVGELASGKRGSVATGIAGRAALAEGR